MKCNIDTRGRVFRFLTGLLLLTNGVVMYAYNVPAATLGWRALQVLLMLMGAFAIFEGIAGWCALRAMGIKTRF